ncbi:hypothetical protein KUCAC02_028164, partial [Chaenocephalus aceratus]
LSLSAERTAAWSGTQSRRYRMPSWTQVCSHSPTGRRRRYRAGVLVETPKYSNRPYRGSCYRRLPCWDIGVRTRSVQRHKDRILSG